MKALIRALLRYFDISVFRGYVIPLHRRHIQKAIGIAQLFQGLPAGAIVECGVGKARTFTILAYLAQGRTLYGFDSFEGFPNPTNEDISPRNPQKGQWAYLTPGDVLRILTTAGMPTNNIKLYKGFFQNTIPKFPPQPIAFLHLDVDLYQSYKDCLALSQYVVPGGIILFDEYHMDAWPGATKAINEWISETRHILQYDPVLKRYFVRF
jgi:O-methyltransferase